MTWQLRLLLIGGSLAAAFWFGREWRDRSCDLEIANIQIQADAAREEMQDALIDAAMADQQRVLAERAAREAEGRVIERRVIEYVQDPDAGKCDLPDEWVLLHDDGWRNAAASGGTESSYGAERAISDVEALAVATDNARICGELAAEVDEWNAWYERIKETINGQ